ncbi:MAG: hypothetical protein IJO32_00700 [Bacilli bacterium]|nr:hypothetical protein [Bacilli bacterium]
MAKKKGKIIKIVGRIDKKICDDYGITNYKNTVIVQSLDFYAHVTKHIKDFQSVDSYNNTITNIDYIIKKPLFVYHDASKNSLLYYSEIGDEYVCLVVKLFEKKDNYVATVYPVSQSKIEKMRGKSLIQKYSKKEKVTE